jgi:hypothetical protein
LPTADDAFETGHDFNPTIIGEVDLGGIGYAGPCSAEIDRMQARIDAKLEAKAAAGPIWRESAEATMNRQPTPGSIAAAEARLGELSPQTVEIVKAAMARAREADRAGNQGACEQALAEVQRAIDP